MQRRIAAALFAVMFLVAAGQPDEALKKEQEKLKGAWVVESFEAGGKKLDQLTGLTYRFDGDKLFTTMPGKKEVEGSCKLDPSKKPAHIDLYTPRFDGGKTTTRAIYKLDGNTLTIASGTTTTTTTTDAKGKATEKLGERPAKFDSKLGGLIVLKREKK